MNNKVQNKIIYSSGNILVTSVPGSGKTHTLIQRLSHLIKDKNISQEEILVLTFTNEAVNEIIERSPFLNHKKKIFIMTIDKFASTVCKLGNNLYKANLENLISEAIKTIKDNYAIKDFFLKNFKYVMIDEFQDTSIEQYRLLHKIFYPYYNIMVIGDPNQSIYGWRGSKGQKIFDIFIEHYKPKQFFMDYNYRSVYPIIDMSKTFLALNESYVSMKPTKFESKHKIKLVYYDNINLNHYIYNQIKKYINLGYNYSDIGILHRYNIEYAKMNIKDLNNFLEINDIPTTTNKYINTKNNEKIINYIIENIKNLSYKDIENKFNIHLTNLFKGLLRNINIDNYEPYIYELKKEIKNINRIEMMTIHGSKGKQFKIVFLLHPVLIPELEMNKYNYPELVNPLEGEELRLSYVGVTRAMNFLEIITNQKIMNYSFHNTDTNISDFLGV